MNFSRRGALMRGVGFSILRSWDRHDALETLEHTKLTSDVFLGFFILGP